jgi:hypothetical protein
MVIVRAENDLRKDHHGVFAGLPVPRYVHGNIDKNNGNSLCR